MEYKEKLMLFCADYGKIFSFLFLAFVSVGLLCVIVVETLPHKLHVSFLDIGQGDSILIQTPSGHTMIIDGGPSNLVLGKLSEHLSYFDRDIDVMIATHPDSDHVTGLIPILGTFDVHSIIESGSKSDTEVFKELADRVDSEHADMHVGHAGDVIDFQDGVTFTILHPYTNEHFKDTNSASVSGVLSYGDELFLLTGDLPSTNEPLLISSGMLPKNISVYKAGHHGSKYSSSDQLLSYIHPQYSIVSAGKDNKYGHPNLEALLRLQKYSNTILSTIDSGTISFSTDGKKLEVETEK